MKVNLHPLISSFFFSITIADKKINCISVERELLEDYIKIAFLIFS